MSTDTYPDRRITVLEMRQAADKVFVRAQITGTDPDGTLFWPRPSGTRPRPFAFESWSIYRLSKGLVAQQWSRADARLAMKQMRLQLLRGLTEALNPSSELHRANEELVLPSSPPD
jgi:hypothetical protein